MEHFKFLKKWPNWLRWGLALPLAVLLSFIFKFLTIISLNYTGIDTKSIFGEGVLLFYDATVGIFMFIYLIASIVPTHKLAVAIGASIIYGIVHIVSATITILNQHYFFDSLVVSILYYCVSLSSFIISCVCINKTLKEEENNDNL